MVNVTTNLNILTPSRKRLRVGDVFVLQPRGYPYYFCRVIRLDAKIWSMENCILIYIYNATSERKDHIPALDKHNLLVHPIMINRLPWSRGYFETVGNIPLDEEDVLHPHCFESLRGGYRDDYGNVVPERVEPCGVYALSSFRTVDDRVSMALGIPLAPD